MNKSKECVYPDCLHCPNSECVVNYPVKRARYQKDLEKSRELQRRYREKKRIENGVKTEKEIQIEKQNKIYDFIVRYTMEHLYPPTSVDIQNEFGITNSMATRDIKRLAERGLIKIGNGYRAYQLVGYKLVKEN